MVTVKTPEQAVEALMGLVDPLGVDRSTLGFVELFLALSFAVLFMYNVVLSIHDTFFDFYFYKYIPLTQTDVILHAIRDEDPVCIFTHAEMRNGLSEWEFMNKCDDRNVVLRYAEVLLRAIHDSKDLDAAYVLFSLGCCGLCVFNQFSSTKWVGNALHNAWPSLVSLVVWFCSMTFIFAVLGTLSFAGSYYQFRTVSTSFYTLFAYVLDQAVMANQSDDLQPAWDEDALRVMRFCTAFTVVLILIGVNLLLAVVVNAYTVVVEEQKQRDAFVLDAKYTFDQFDTDHGDSMDTSEFTDACKSLGLEVDHQRVEKLFETNDKDGDGTLSFEEFQELVDLLLLIPIEEQHRQFVLGIDWLFPALRSYALKEQAEAAETEKEHSFGVLAKVATFKRIMKRTQKKEEETES